jgi:hypothetical protein
MKGERSKLYSDANDFYALSGNNVMKLSPSAAIAVCRTAANNGLVIARVEGGIWLSPGFEARLDCIWNGADPPISVEAADRNNLIAGDFILQQGVAHTAFILTAAPLAGWPQRTE